MAHTPATHKHAALVAHPHALHPAGVYDEHERELIHLEVAAALQEILGEPLIRLIKNQQAHLDNPDHPIHQDVAEAFHARISGRWTLEKFDAPVEWYAARIHLNKGRGQTVSQAEVDALDFYHLPAATRALADKAMRRDKRPLEVTGWDDSFDNLFTTSGVSALWNQAANGGVANSGAAVPKVNAWFNNAQSVIGVGDSSTAAANTQFDLQAASNREWVGMDATYPTLPGTGSNQIVFRSTFGGTLANYAWNEFAIANDGGSNVTIPGSAARLAPSGSNNGNLLDRVVSAQGTKTNGQSWVPSMTLSIS